MIPEDLRALMEPQERFEQIRRLAVRLGPRLVDLSYPNPLDGIADGVRAVLRAALESQRPLDFQYSPYGGQTLIRRAVAEALSTSHDAPFEPDDVVLTPGAMAALQLALRASGASGDTVIVPTPCWLDYPLYVRSAGMVPRLVPLPEPSFELDAQRIVDACDETTCAVMLCQPANPTGRTFDHAAIGALAQALRAVEERTGRAITVIADETHRDFAPRFVSPAAAWARTFIVYSFGKYHLLQGQRTGYVACAPRHPERTSAREEVVRWARITAAYAPTSLMQRAIPALLTLRHDHGPIDRRRERVRDRLASANIEVTDADATFFAWARIPRGQDDFTYVRELAKRGVLVLPAPLFHASGWFRLSLTCPDDALERGLDRICEGAG